MIPSSSFSQKLSLSSIHTTESSFERYTVFNQDLLEQQPSQFAELQKAPQQIPAASILPQYARENPTGYSYLCRLELSLEQSMPVSLWLKLGEQSYGQIKGNVHAQIKLKRF